MYHGYCFYKDNIKCLLFADDLQPAGPTFLSGDSASNFC